jgi:hypothetical protein
MVQLSLASATVLNKLATSIISHKFGDHAYYLKVQYIVTIMRDVRELFALTRIVGRHGRHKDDDDFSAM